MNMKLLPIQEAYQKIFDRQNKLKLKGLRIHANGHCAHTGKLSPGCVGCFAYGQLKMNVGPSLFGQPNLCQANCDYCTDNRESHNNEKKTKIHTIPDIFKQEVEWALSRVINEKSKVHSLSFSGGGDPILHLDMIAHGTKYFKNFIEPELKSPIWYYVYTNGMSLTNEKLLFLKEIGFDEIRIHIGASNFSEKIYRTIEEAVGILNTVSIETPSWPNHRKELFEMLPIIDKIGVRHLNLGQVELRHSNMKALSDSYPEGEYTEFLEWHLNDGGLVYDIIEEVLDKKYKFSVLDCNGFVKKMQRAVSGNILTKGIMYDDYDYEGWFDLNKWRVKFK